MKLVLSWLTDFVTLNNGVTATQIEETLIQLGHEVDAVTHTGGPNQEGLAQVVVGRILSREKHPNADRLGVCLVDVGDAAGPRQIVCGAPNARAGLTVAVALPGAVLSPKDGQGDAFEIKAGVIRGEASNGMICSQRELGLGEGDEGIWELDAAAPGMALRDILGGAEPAETVLEVSVTPNRGDCLSQHGLARELAAAGLGTYQLPGVPAAGQAAAEIQVDTRTDDCPLLMACTVTNVRMGPSPDWVQKRLRAAGMRPRNAIVDATNYVMLMLGQPLHGYDAARLGGRLCADRAEAGEAFAGLGDINLRLHGGETVMRDATGQVAALGGILGGRESGVSEATTAVVLESAYFDRGRTALTGQAHGVHTDARSRFERGVDPALVEVALRQCAAYVADWCGADARTDVSEIVSAGRLPAAAQPIVYRPALMADFGGLLVAETRQREILTRLGFAVAETAQNMWQVQPPTWRTYMQTPEDIVEEVLRVEGYAQVPSVLPPLPGTATSQGRIERAARVSDGGSRPVLLDRQARRVLAANGVQEVLSYSFIGREMAERFCADAHAREELIEVANPLAETSMTTMRPSLLPGLLQVLAGNRARHEASARLGEAGKVFGGQGERLMAAVLLAEDDTRHWRSEKGRVDVFAAKGLAETLLGQLGAPVGSAQVGQGAESTVYHPGRSGTLRVGPMLLARFGELHPQLVRGVLKGLDIAGPLAVVELELEPLLKLQQKTRAFVNQNYPPVKRDLAFVVGTAVTAADVRNTVLKSAAGNKSGTDNLLKEARIFDVYQGDNVAAGTKSLALALTLQAPDRTLSEVDIGRVLDAAVQAVQAAHGGQLRA